MKKTLTAKPICTEQNRDNQLCSGLGTCSSSKKNQIVCLWNGTNVRSYESRRACKTFRINTLKFN